LNAITKAIADTLNRHAVPRLFEINSWKLDELPKFEPTNIDPPDLNQLASFITATAGAGMQWFPDPELEKFLRDIARLPEMSDETEEIKREMYTQQQAMSFAEQQMQMLGMKQKAEMTAQGYSPEQAEMASQTPTPEIAAQQRIAEDDAELAHREHPIGQEEMALQQREMQMQEQQMAPEEDSPAEQARHEREKEKLALQEQAEQRRFGREKEKVNLQERLEQRKSEREKVKMREQLKQQRRQPPKNRGSR
jgi:hypothetical protein